ncbi:DUF4276 family protein [Cobetia sp. D5]|uniref:DUF4276 family protein n=1 Tax=Cobetia sp. D5 TaxID=3105867 RepID=UPI002D77D175|nr:DUF4276 family protein [Cobetia sp. D5]
MTRVHIICEGQTEEQFISEVLAEAFWPKGIYLQPALIGRPGHKGGNLKFERLYRDIELRLLGDKDALCTTFFDFYGLPEDFPGKQEASQKRFAAERSCTVLDAMIEALCEKLGEAPLRRFIPYIQMHEFEGLLFSDPEALSNNLDRSALAPLQQIRNSFTSPEEINNSPQTAPSKRIQGIYPRYDKPLHGTLAALEMGTDSIRQACPLFSDWLERIEDKVTQMAGC